MLHILLCKSHNPHPKFVSNMNNIMYIYAGKYVICTDINNATIVISKENKEISELGFTERNQD